MYCMCWKCVYNCMFKIHLIYRQHWGICSLHCSLAVSSSKEAGTRRIYSGWLFSVAEFYYRVWQLTLGTHTFNIPLPTVNSFYNQAALTQTQEPYEKLRYARVIMQAHSRVTIWVGELCPSPVQTQEESIISEAALYYVQIIIRLITHAAHSLYHSISFSWTFYILCISLFLLISVSVHFACASEE